jgi:hypothetical protein
MLQKATRLSALGTAIFIGIFKFLSSAASAQQSPPFPDVVLSEPIIIVTDTLSAGIVAVPDVHRVGFNTTATSLSDSAIIWIAFPAGFNIATVSDVEYSDNDPSNDGDEPSVSSWEAFGQTLKCYFYSGDQPAVPGSRISLQITNLFNANQSGSYTIIVFASDSLENIGHGPAGSAPFLLSPGDLHHVVVAPGSDSTIAAGSSIAFSAGGYDQYNNIISGLSFNYAVTVDSCGDIVDGIFTADKLGSCYVTASSGGITDSSGLITVVPGPFGRFALTGTPANRTAGVPFSSPVIVRVYDVRDNIKTDYSGIVWFVSTDPAATLPFTIGSPFNFPVDSAGVARFAGAGFTLYTAGSRTVSVTNGTFSASSNPIQIFAAAIVTFELSAGLNQTAGQSFVLSVPYPSAQDEYGNPASGNVIVSDSIGGGNSPNGIPPVLNPIAVINGSGSAYQTLTNATPTVLQGSVAGVVVLTDSIIVAAGSFQDFSMSGYPSNLIAGNTFPGGVTVTAFDAYGNREISFSDTAYFISSDPLAELHPGHRFTVQDSGRYVFNGNQFSLRTAGPQTITVISDTVSDTSGPINVSAASLANFLFSSPPPFVTCGIPFMLGIFDGEDQWGNPAGGVVTIDAYFGGGSSPNGTDPILNAIQVVGGIGSANQTLVRATPTVLRGTSGPAVALTDTIEVRPGSLGEFDLEISSPQYNDSAFTGAADLTAYDEYGNIKTNYSAPADTVVITSSAGGSMSNNVLRLAGDFINGVADLVAKRTTFSGRGGMMTFTAASQSGIVGISGPVEMRAIACENVIIDQGIASWGDTVTGSVDVSNDGGVTVDINEIDIFTLSGIIFNPTTVTPNLPAQIGAGQQQTFVISFAIPNGATVGVHPVSGAVFGAFGGIPVSDTLEGFPDTLEIQSISEIGYVSGSLSRDTLSTGSWYTLSMLISNTGGAGLALFDSTNFSFTDGARQFRADISSGVYLPPGSSQGTLILLDSALVDPAFASGSYQPVFNYYGRENGDFVSGSFNLSDMVTIQQGINIHYFAGSISIDSLVQGQNAVFTIRMRNDGDAPFIINHDFSRLTFSDPVRQFIAYSDTSTAVRVDILPPGVDTVFHFAPTILVPEFATGMYLPLVTLRGTQNGQPEVRQFDTSPDSVAVLTRAALQIDSTYTMSRNAPFVNTAQPCSAKVAISNLGLEPVSSLYVRLAGDNYLDSIFISGIIGGGNAAVIFNLNPVSSPDSGLILTASISGGTGTISGEPPSIMQPVDNTALLIVETPADLSLSPLAVVAPPEAMDDTITIDQPITLSAWVANFGMAEIEGSRRLTLDVGSSGFILSDSAARDFNLDEAVFWDVAAPGNANDSSVLTVRILNRPIDVNDGSDAVGADSVSSRTFVVNTSPTISHHAVISGPNGALDHILSTGQNFVVTDTVNALGIYEGLTALLVLPAGFSTQDPLPQIPVGGLVSWTVRAPDSPAIDSITVTTWLFDPNTGDSSGARTSLALEVVQKATLNLLSSIAGPLEALDGILEPAASFQYEAVVRNLGGAAAGQGVVSLHLGDSSLTVFEDPIQSFNPDIPVVWNITVPDSETTVPIPVWTLIDFIPFDENTDAPAFVINDSSTINITVKELLPELVITMDNFYRGSVYKGQTIDIMTFTLRNRDRGGSFQVSLDSILFTVLLSPQSSMNEVFSTIALISDSVSYNPLSTADDTVRFAFDNAMILAPGESRQFILHLVISPNAGIDYFQLFLNSSDINGSILEGGTPTIRLAAVSSRGEPESFSSRPAVIVEQDFSSSVSSYPNPFNPRAEQARIGYYLAEDSDLEIRIFTLLGELVWSKSISSSDPLGRAGLHSESTYPILWDGKNDAGSEVRSGVYICLLKNETSGEEEKLKIAVVK